MFFDIGYGVRARWVQCLSPLLLTWSLSGCALLPAPMPVSAPVMAACEQQDAEIARLQQLLVAKDAQIQQQRVQQKVQATELQETTGEVTRAEIKLRRLATQADAASQLAEVEVALHSLRSEPLPQRAVAQLQQAQRILGAGAASFAQSDYGAAVDFAAQSLEIIDMVASGRKSTLAARSAVEVPFQVAVVLRTRVDSNLRAQPGLTKTVLAVLPQGSSLRVHAYRGEWLRVSTEDERAGWVRGDLLEAPYPDVK